MGNRADMSEADQPCSLDKITAQAWRIPLFLHALKSWCKEREKYPSRLEVTLANTLSAGMPIHVRVRRSSHRLLIDETLTASTADRLTTALQALRDMQGLRFQQGFGYMTLFSLLWCDLERAQQGKRSLLLPKQQAQREENGQEARSPLWSLDDVLRFWETFDGRLNQGFPPPEGRIDGQWTYTTIPPLWQRDNVHVLEMRLCPSISEPPTRVPVMVPAPWKEWVENLVALLQVPEKHGVQINISLGAVVAESQAEYVGGKNIFRQKGEVWDIVYQGHSFSLKHIKGLHYVAFLLRHPAKKFTPLQLSQGIGESIPTKSDSVCSSMSEAMLANQNLRVSAWDDKSNEAEERADKQTIVQCRQKWEDLSEQKAEAERHHDYERAAQLQDDIDIITDYLTKTTFRGRSRKFQTDSDRIRTSVTRRIHDAVNKIRQQDDILARQLHNCIKTGNWCSYNPDPQNPISWSF